MVLDALIAAVFSIFGVSLTLLVQWLGSRSKIQYETFKIYAEKLTHVRLKTYPSLYTILSDAVKHFDFPEIHSDPIDKIRLERNLSEWDSKNGYLLTEMSGGRAYLLRKVLRANIERKQLACPAIPDEKQSGKCSYWPLKKWLKWLSKRHSRETVNRIPSDHDIRYALVELEISLRVDLKVYALEYYNVRRGFRAYQPIYR